LSLFFANCALSRRDTAVQMNGSISLLRENTSYAT
jgi:hypothetical protein